MNRKIYIGKNIVKLLLETSGFNVHNLGVDVDPFAIIVKAWLFWPHAIWSWAASSTGEVTTTMHRFIKICAFPLPSHCFGPSACQTRPIPAICATLWSICPISAEVREPKCITTRWLLTCFPWYRPAAIFFPDILPNRWNRTLCFPGTTNSMRNWALLRQSNREKMPIPWHKSFTRNMRNSSRHQRRGSGMTRSMT